MAVQTVEPPTFASMIDEAAVQTEALAREYFGAGAYLVRDTAIDRETGREDAVFEVHYCFPDPDGDFDRLVALHRAFTDSFVRATDRAILHRIIVREVPSDAD